MTCFQPRRRRRPLVRPEKPITGDHHHDHPQKMLAVTAGISLPIAGLAGAASAQALFRSDDAGRVAKPFRPLRAGYSHLNQHGVPVYLDVPAGCVVRRNWKQAFEPFVTAFGDTLVIDTDDRMPIDGRLFWLRSGGGSLWEVRAAGVDAWGKPLVEWPFIDCSPRIWIKDSEIPIIGRIVGLLEGRAS